MLIRAIKNKMGQEGKWNLPLDPFLLGSNAHRRFYYPFYSELLAKTNVNEYQNAAVAVILINKVHTVEIVFMERVEHPKDKHSGQISFPGGKFDKNYDENLYQTAVRETYEELGLQLLPHYLIGSLSPIDILVSKIRVQPYLFYLEHEPTWTIDPKEVNTILKENIDYFVEENILMGEILVDNKGISGVNYVNLHNRKLWGATMMIMWELQMLNQLKVWDRL